MSRELLPGEEAILVLVGVGAVELVLRLLVCEPGHIALAAFLVKFGNDGLGMRQTGGSEEDEQEAAAFMARSLRNECRLSYGPAPVRSSIWIKQAKKNPLPCGSGFNPIPGELEETDVTIVLHAFDVRFIIVISDIQKPYIWRNILRVPMEKPARLLAKRALFVSCPIL